MAEKIDYTEYDKVMSELTEKFQQALKESLAKPYPYAPGYKGGKRAFGVRNMKSKTGNLYNSINVSFNPTTNEVIIKMLDYWRNVNDGRRPGKYVPIKPLMDWIKVKGINKSRNKKTGKFQKFNAKSLAFAISSSIKQFGIQPTNFYDDAFMSFEKEFENEAIQALGIDISNFFEKVVEENI